MTGAYCVIHEFLTANAFRELVTYFLDRQGLMKSSGPEGDVVRVFEKLGPLQELLTAAMLDTLPDVALRCGVAPFDSPNVDMRLISRSHTSLAPIHAEAPGDGSLDFILFAHREPRRFEGGMLLLRDSSLEVVIEPAQNSIVFFRSSLAAQTAAVRAASGALVDSRLTLEGRVSRSPHS